MICKLDTATLFFSPTPKALHSAQLNPSLPSINLVATRNAQDINQSNSFNQEHPLTRGMGFGLVVLGSTPSLVFVVLISRSELLQPSLRHSHYFEWKKKKNERTGNRNKRKYIGLNCDF